MRTRSAPRTDQEPLRFRPVTDADGPLSAEDALAAVESVSRRMEDLARELNCLGFFDDEDDDRPKAA